MYWNRFDCFIAYSLCRLLLQSFWKTSQSTEINLELTVPYIFPWSVCLLCCDIYVACKRSSKTVLYGHSKYRGQSVRRTQVAIRDCLTLLCHLGILQAVVLLALLTMYLVWIVFIMCIRGKNWTEFLLPMSSTDWKEGGSEKRDGYSRRQLEESSSQLENPIESNEEDEDARSVDGDQHDTTTTESLTEFEESTIGILTEVTMDFIEPTVLARYV